MLSIEKTLHGNHAGRKGEYMLLTFLAKGIADFTFGGAFVWYLIKYIISGAVALGAILLGIKLRKKKNAKLAAAESGQK